MLMHLCAVFRCLILRILVFALIATLQLSGCKENKKPGKQDESIKLAVKEDSKLQDSQEDLLRKRGSLTRAKKQLDQERMALEVKKRQLAPGDTQGAQVLKEQEKSLVQKEKAISKQEDELDSQMLKLMRQRSALLAKATAALTSSSARGPEVKMAGREAELARREASLARREALMAQREAAVASREKEVAKGCVPAAPVYTITKIQAPSGPGAKQYSRNDVQSVLGRAVTLMRSRGIRNSDLPSGVSRLRTDIQGYVRKKQFYRGKYAADQFYQIIKSIKVDRGFVGAKMARLHRYVRNKKLTPDKEKTVNELLRQATSAYSDGNFSSANRKLNRIYSVIR